MRVIGSPVYTFAAGLDSVSAEPGESILRHHPPAPITPLPLTPPPSSQPEDIPANRGAAMLRRAVHMTRRRAARGRRKADGPRRGRVGAVERDALRV